MEEEKDVQKTNEERPRINAPKGFGIAALVISILSVLFFKYIFISVIFALISIVLGFLGLRKGDNIFARAGLFIGIISLLITILLFVVLNLLDTVLFYVPDWYKQLK